MLRARSASRFASVAATAARYCDLCHGSIGDTYARYGKARAQQTDDGLAVGDGTRERPFAGGLEGQPVNLDHFGALVRGGAGRNAGREEEVQDLGEHPGRGQAVPEPPPARGSEAALSRDLALPRAERRLGGLELARR